MSTWFPINSKTPPETLSTREKNQGELENADTGTPIFDQLMRARQEATTPYWKGTSTQQNLKVEGEWKDITPKSGWPKKLTTPNTHQLKETYKTAGGATGGNILFTTPLGVVTGLGTQKLPHTTPAANDATITKTPKKSKGEKVTEYAANLQSLLQPFVSAAGELPAQFQSTLGQLKSSPDYTPQDATNTMLSIAQQYSPNIDVNKTGVLSGSISSYESALNNIMGTNSTYMKSLQNFGQDLSAYEKVAPYKSLITALFNRIRYTDIYQGGQFPGVTTWPKWLQDIYSTAGGGGLTSSGKVKTPFNYSIKSIKPSSPLPGTTPTPPTTKPGTPS